LGGTGYPLNTTKDADLFSFKIVLSAKYWAYFSWFHENLNFIMSHMSVSMSALSELFEEKTMFFNKNSANIFFVGKVEIVYLFFIYFLTLIKGFFLVIICEGIIDIKYMLNLLFLLC
jgi:hypothetical protein